MGGRETRQGLKLETDVATEEGLTMWFSNSDGVKSEAESIGLDDWRRQ